MRCEQRPACEIAADAFSAREAETSGVGDVDVGLGSSAGFPRVWRGADEVFG